MANNLWLLAALGAVGSVFVIEPPPDERPSVSQIAGMDSPPIPHIVASRDPAIAARQDPVPLIRLGRAAPASPAPVSAAANPSPDSATTTEPGKEEADRRAARAAVELDGYKRVRIIGKTSDGSWRAKGYRGATEVALTVDDAGRVSSE